MAGTQARATVVTVVDYTSSGDGTTYTGRLVGGKRDGRGACTWPSGTRYDGEWSCDKMSGRGAHTLHSGDAFEGEFRNGRLDGWGTHRSATGWYEGLYREDRWKRGTWHHRNGVDVLDGDWNGGGMQGLGVQRRIINSNNNTNNCNNHNINNSNDNANGVVRMETVYEGEWDRDKWHGRGTWRSPVTGDIYHGMFDHGKRSGSGRMLFGDDNGSQGGGGGGSYVGEWRGDMFHGRGVRLWANGDRYEGQWEWGNENGEGTKTWSRDGSSFTGLWEMGVPKKGARRWPNGDMFEGTFTCAQPQGNGWEMQGEGVMTLTSSEGHKKVANLRGILINNTFQGQTNANSGSPTLVQKHLMGSPFENTNKQIEALKKEYTKELKATKNRLEQINERNNKQHIEEINQLHQKVKLLEKVLEKQKEQQASEPGHELFPPSSSEMKLEGRGATVLPEMNKAFILAIQFQSQIKKAAPELLGLEKSVEKLIQSLQGATQHNEKLASHLRDLVALKDTLGKQIDETDFACKKVLGETLTIHSSEAEIQQCSRTISELTKKVMGIKPQSEGKEEIVVPSHKGISEELLTPSILPTRAEEADHFLGCTTTTEPFQLLGTLSETLTQLQAFQFEGSTELTCKCTTLSKELSQQVTLGNNLHDQVVELQGVCSELMKEHRTKWILMRGLEGDERSISFPGVWSQLCALLPQAQQSTMDLMVAKATSLASLVSSSSTFGSMTQPPQQQQSAATTLPGCTSSTSPGITSSSTTNNSMCIECDERPPNIQFLPCGHTVLCSQCASVVRKCPQCRTPITKKQSEL
ncbi:2-isopropylmalate synthase [Pelomyxa schiedti]|nr:2-isopropylmalate synthase [Pelomyxa schiedti]